MKRLGWYIGILVVVFGLSFAVLSWQKGRHEMSSTFVSQSENIQDTTGSAAQSTTISSSQSSSEATSISQATAIASDAASASNEADNSSTSTTVNANETSSGVGETSGSTQSTSTTEKKRPVAPDTQLLTATGETIQLSSKFGKPVVVNFWASWCPPCREEMPYFQEAYEKYGDKVEFIMVNATGSRPSETQATAAQYLTDQQLTLPVYYDINLQNQQAFGIRLLPTTFILNEKGELLMSGSGQISREELMNALANITTKE